MTSAGGETVGASGFDDPDPSSSPRFVPVPNILETTRVDLAIGTRVRLLDSAVLSARFQ
jgi:hypothetical protein